MARTLAPIITANWHARMSDLLETMEENKSPEGEVFEAIDNLMLDETISIPNASDLADAIGTDCGLSDAEKSGFLESELYKASVEHNPYGLENSISPLGYIRLWQWGGKYLEEATVVHSTRFGGADLMMEHLYSLIDPRLRPEKPMDLSDFRVWSTGTEVASKLWDAYIFALGERPYSVGQWAFAVSEGFEFPFFGNWVSPERSAREFFDTVHPAFDAACAEGETIAWDLLLVKAYGMKYSPENGERLKEFTLLSKNHSAIDVKPYIDGGITSAVIIGDALENGIDAEILMSLVQQQTQDAEF